ncbi:hypothetical protein C1H46_019603 [Malus baccata]|uniref:Uncharacterized protein n=1 Tax=Malus baccata TaxID=106549 RepID=A0A540M7T1_MALBA|nr:hypothetical protein C1H46_019602 [Malus baccata]TQD94810.1 hypothetical protein C1H46_019603 [Malus baccata]
MLHFVDKDTNLVSICYFSTFMLETSLLSYLFSFYSFQSFHVRTFLQSTTSAFGEPIPEIPVVSEVTNPQASQSADPLNVVVTYEAPISQPKAFGKGSGIIPHSSTSKDGHSPQNEITYPSFPSLVLNLTQGSGKVGASPYRSWGAKQNFLDLF